MYLVSWIFAVLISQQVMTFLMNFLFSTLECQDIETALYNLYLRL